MENQINMGDQNPQQVDQNPMSQPVITPGGKGINYWMISTILLAGVVIFLLVYSYNKLKSQTYTEKTNLILQPSPTASVVEQPEETPSASPAAGKVYKNNPFGVSIRYPLGWLGPEVYEAKDGFYFEVGTDVVYPYGTDRAERKYEKKNSYYITVQYGRKPPETPIEEYKKNQPWLEQYLPLLTMRDGETKTYEGIVFTRVRQSNKNNFKGVEYTVSLSPIDFHREVLLVNDNYDTFRIEGSPKNVEVINEAEWKTAFQVVDEANLNTFREVVNSISF